MICLLRGLQQRIGTGPALTRIPRILGPSSLLFVQTHDDGNEICHEACARDDRVAHDPCAASLASELQAQSTIDHSKNHERPAVPDVDVAYQADGLMLGKISVVQVAEDGLETQKDDHDQTQSRMGLLPELDVPSLVSQAELDRRAITISQGEKRTYE